MNPVDTTGHGRSLWAVLVESVEEGDNQDGEGLSYGSRKDIRLEVASRRRALGRDVVHLFLVGPWDGTSCTCSWCVFPLTPYCLLFHGPGVVELEPHSLILSLVEGGDRQRR